jgi:hypothetical protein
MARHGTPRTSSSSACRSGSWIADYHGDPDDPVEIDVEIVPLIRAIWAFGFDTELSCQDQDGYVWVELPGKHAQRLLNVIAGEDSELRANILRLVPAEVEEPWRAKVPA